MSVASSVTLPAQPTVGATVFRVLGGDGMFAPIGEYVVDMGIVGDAGGGVASLTVEGDPRFCNVFRWLNPAITASAAAADFSLQLLQTTSSIEAPAVVTGTMPFIAAAISTLNSSLLHYPPIMFYPGNGAVVFTTDNVGVLETYRLRLQCLVFDINAPQRVPLSWLMQNMVNGTVVGNSP